MHPVLLDVLVDKANNLARQFLSIVIRAVHYCPPVDLHFGEFLQAMVTADRDLVPDDRWGYREALIDAFRERGIRLRNVASLSETSLVWQGPRTEIPRIKALSFAELRFDGEPGRAWGKDESRKRACALGDIATDPRFMAEFGLAAPDDPRLGESRVDLPEVQSIRSLRRIGPEGQAVFDIVAEIIQKCTVPGRKGRRGFSYWGGSTVLIDPDGGVRYTILKNVASEGRRKRRLEYLEDRRAAQFWTVKDNVYVLRESVSKALHRRIGAEKSETQRDA